MTCATSSTPRARPANPRASRSGTPASATSSGSPAEVYGICAGRPRLSGHDHRLRLLRRGDLGAPVFRSDTGRRPRRTQSGRRRTCPSSWKPGGSPPCAASRRFWPRSTTTCRCSGSSWFPARPARKIWSSGGTAGQNFLNVYGPTEATVTATWTLLAPDKPVTIGVPLPTYKILILAPGEARLAEKGASEKSASPASVWPSAMSTGPI